MGIVSFEVVFYVFEAIVALGFLAIVYYFWKQARKSKHQRHARKVVESLGVKYLHDVVLPDGVDGLVFIDYLLLVPTGFVVLNTEHSKGHIFGGEAVDQWSQVINNRTYKFNNPLYANQTACQAVLWNLQHNIESENSSATPDWQVHGWVAFSNAGNFPKGIPAHVSMIDELKTNLAPLLDDKVLNNNNAIEENQLRAWDSLHNLSISTKAENKQ
jgi:hypothetical protein